jgi:amidase
MVTPVPVDGFSSATEMLVALRRRQVSAEELLDLHIRRIERYNPRLNAVVTTDLDSARDVARASDVARGQGHEAPLLGLPMTVKDCLQVRGLRSTWGVAQFREHVAELDAPVIARVRRAGAVIMGKTNLSPWTEDDQASNLVFGRTNNPWDVSRTTGGSCGGAAAALAAGLTPLEFGNDVGGSVRNPPAFCGVYGHRPSETALAKSGQFPGKSPWANPALLMCVIGPMARTAEDLSLALDVAAGPDVGEDVAWRLEMPSARWDDLRDFRVAVLPRIPWLPVEPEIWAGLEHLVEELRRRGVRVAEAQPAGFEDLRHHHQVYLSILAVISYWDLEAERRRALLAKWRLGDDFLAALAAGLEAKAADFVGWLEERELFRRSYRAFFREWDVLLTPMSVLPAFPHMEPTLEPGDFFDPARTITVDGRTIPFEWQEFYAEVAVLSGQPATSFPFGLTASGLPIGLQAIGPYLEDRTPITFAALVARELGGCQRPPGYDEA